MISLTNMSKNKTKKLFEREFTENSKKFNKKL
jgi:hypothetical protein